MKAPVLYIFDFDGTLADTLPLCLACFRIVCHVYLGTNLTDGEIRSYFGPSEEKIIRNLVRDNWHGAHEADSEKRILVESAAVELFYWLYAELHELIDVSYCESSVRGMLDELRHRGKRLALVTGKGRRSLLISLMHLGLTDYFDAIVSDDEVDRPKPYPDGIRKVLDELGVGAHEAAFVGDMNADICAARSAGVDAIAAAWFPSDFRINLRADATYDDPLGLLQYEGNSKGFSNTTSIQRVNQWK